MSGFRHSIIRYGPRQEVEVFFVKLAFLSQKKKQKQTFGAMASENVELCVYIKKAGEERNEMYEIKSFRNNAI